MGEKVPTMFIKYAFILPTPVVTIDKMLVARRYRSADPVSSAHYPTSLLACCLFFVARLVAPASGE